MVNLRDGNGFFTCWKSWFFTKRCYFCEIGVNPVEDFHKKMLFL